MGGNTTIPSPPTGCLADEPGAPSLTQPHRGKGGKPQPFTQGLFYSLPGWLFLVSPPPQSGKTGNYNWAMTPYRVCRPCKEGLLAHDKRLFCAQKAPFYAHSG